jgi:vacuolar-type H+-ATPase subunit B/Vma2
MLSVSMGMEPVMPMAQGGGLSTVQNSLNINGEPHRLAYINPSEESLLQQLGGSGRKIDGIPAYYDDSVGDDGGPAGSPDDDVGGFGDMGLGGYSPLTVCRRHRSFRCGSCSSRC